MSRLSNFNFAVLVVICLLLAGCSKEYNAERALWKAERHAKNIAKNPDAIPPAEYQMVIEAYRSVIIKYSGFNLIEKAARLGLGRFYILKKDFEAARREFKEILRLYPEDRGLLATVQFSLGNTYEKEGQWEKALIEYKKIMEEFPKSNLAMQMPIYIAGYYKKEKNEPARREVLEDAFSYYQKIASENPRTALGYSAENLTAFCYLKLNEWEKAVEALEALVRDYPGSRAVARNLRLISDICVKKLNSPQMAITIYERFISENPNHLLVNKIKERIETIKQQGDKDVFR